VNPVVAVNRHGESFTHAFATVTAPSGRSWFQCSCSEQCPTRDDAAAHLNVVREWNDHEGAIARSAA
jgi:hypothetical protein